MPFSRLHTRPKQPYGPPRSALPLPCGPAGSHARGNMQSGPCCSAASQPEKDPTTQKEAHVNRNDQDVLKTNPRKGGETTLYCEKLRKGYTCYIIAVLSGSHLPTVKIKFLDGCSHKHTQCRRRWGKEPWHDQSNAKKNFIRCT